VSAAELEERRSSTGATREAHRGVVETTDHKLTFEARREGAIDIAELRQRLFDHPNCLYPLEQCCIDLGDLERENGAFTRIGCQPECCCQMGAGRLAPRTGLRARRLTQDLHSQRRRGRLGERTLHQVSRRQRCTIHRRLRGFTQASQHPGITGGLHANKVRGDFSRWSPINMEQACRPPMGGVPLVAVQGRLQRLADNGVKKAGRVPSR
jgi:hypothetical protein